MTKAFRIDADDTSTGALPATRPNSRADNAAQFEDLSQAHATATADVQKSFQQQDDANDEDLQRAINMSLGHEMPEQENGVTGTGQQFGEAKRAYYDPMKWSMMPVATSREVTDHPPPSKRKRVEGHPAFLRGSKDTAYLGALLTIYHGIPLAREALLLPPLTALAYGHDPTWWSGTSDENIKSLSLEADHAYIERGKVNLLAEVQCLMAFLDRTDRAYGSTNSLADLDYVRTYRTAAPFGRFLSAWEEAATSLCAEEQLTQVFCSSAAKNLADSDEIFSKDFVSVETPINRNSGETLVDLLDRDIWHDDAQHLEDIWLSHCAEIFTIKVHDQQAQDKELGIAIPAVWYPDRYTWDCRAITQQMRTEIHLLRKEITKYQFAQRSCQFVRDRSGAIVHVKDVLDAAMKSSTSANEQRGLSELDQAAVQAAKSELEAIVHRIDEKLEVLEEKKNELEKQVRNIRLQLTKPSSDPEQPPFMKYVLQGVSTKHNIVYIKRRNQDLLGMDDEGNSHSEWMWWRIWWSEGGVQEEIHPPMIGPATQAQASAAQKSMSDGWAQEVSNLDELYTVTRVSEEEVLEAAKSEHHSAVLVYANENAMRLQGSQLSPALAKFVEQDNLTFAKELRTEQGIQESDGQVDDVMDDLPLDDSEDTRRPERDYTPMSTGSSHRDEDGQPSPKRPKSSDAPFNPSAELLPSYEETLNSPEMQEVKQNKIGMYAERMLEKYGHEREDIVSSEDPGPVKIEHSMDLPR